MRGACSKPRAALECTRPSNPFGALFGPSPLRGHPSSPADAAAPASAASAPASAHRVSPPQVSSSPFFLQPVPHSLPAPTPGVRASSGAPVTRTCAGTALHSALLGTVQARSQRTTVQPHSLLSPPRRPPRPGRWRILHLAAASAFRRFVLFSALNRRLFTGSPRGLPVPRLSGCSPWHASPLASTRSAGRWAAPGLQLSAEHSCAANGACFFTVLLHTLALLGPTKK